MHIVDQAVNEVQERHRFFVDWFVEGKDPETMAVSAHAFGPQMQMFGPDGSVHDSAAVIEMLQNARATRPADFAINIAILHACDLPGDLAMVIYEERQTLRGHRTARRSTAVFQACESAPCGVAWVHLHEIWIDK